MSGNQRSPVKGRRLFKVTIQVHEVVERSDCFDYLVQRSNADRLPRAINILAAQSTASFEMSLLETVRSMQNGAHSAMVENQLKAVALACILDRDSGAKKQVVEFLERNPP
jgi:hypothetical protein